MIIVTENPLSGAIIGDAFVNDSKGILLSGSGAAL